MNKLNNQENNWPSLPDKIDALAGPVKVEQLFKVPGEDGEFTWGDYTAHQRNIRILSTLPREVAWHTLLHEATHVALSDSGLKFSDAREEQLCEVVASAMLRLIHEAFVK